jgi:hypothetical protein
MTIAPAGTIRMWPGNGAAVNRPAALSTSAAFRIGGLLSVATSAVARAARPCASRGGSGR